MATEKTQIALRFDAALIAKIDKRVTEVNARRKRDGEAPISRNSWFEAMAWWVLDSLPHQAVRADLIQAWDSMPEEALDPKAFGRVGEQRG